MPYTATLAPQTVAPQPVGRGFVLRNAMAYLGTAVVLVAPLLVTLALKVDSLVGRERAPSRLVLVRGVGALIALVGNPLFGRLSDRTTSQLGMRRPWMVVGLAGGAGGSYGVLYAVAGACALLGAAAILPVRGVR